MKNTENTQHDVRTLRIAPSRQSSRFHTDASGLCWPHERRSRIFAKLCLCGLTLVMLGIVARVAQLQTAPPQPIANMLDTQNSKTTLLARRGNLTDRHGRIFATTRVAYRLFVDPQMVREPNTFSEHVGFALGINPAYIDKTIHDALIKRPGNRYVVISKRMTDEQVEKFDELMANPPAGKITGIAKEPILVREYPMGPLAGQIIGFTGFEGNGIEGLERQFDKIMAPQLGRVSYWRDTRRKPLWVEPAQYQAPQDGEGVRLSIDAIIQTLAEQHLAQAVTEYKAESGQMVVMSPKTGEVLAMANFPSFDPTNYSKVESKLYRNRCVTDVFEPGSTFKPFVWAMATQTGAMRPGQELDCTTSGVYRLPFGRRLRDSHAVGEVTWEQVLIKSSNIGMALAGMEMGETQSYNTVRSFGFGEKPGTLLPGEAGGLITPRNKWTKYTLTSVPMGQEIAVTPLQIARAFCSFANGGILVQPTVRALNPNLPQDRVAIERRALTPEIADYTRQVLRRVVTEGTGRKANLKTYSLFGKTGTAQMASRTQRGYEENAYMGAFVCGAPYDDPQLVIATFIQRPDHKLGYYGGTVAAPASAQVMEKALSYMGVMPDLVEEDQQVATRR
ncbi:MAG: peptidoglycan D,D-transpeptidase FtsI family protein [Phycisphaeraceae bacterium JB051]